MLNVEFRIEYFGLSVKPALGRVDCSPPYFYHRVMTLINTTIRVAALLAVMVLLGVGCSSPPESDLSLKSIESPKLNQEESAQVAEVGEQMVDSVPESVLVQSASPTPAHALTVLPVPFTSQAPQANWEMPYQEACEEASMVMVVEYFNGNHQSNLETDYADKEILDLIAWEEANGYSVDLTAWEVADVLQKRYKLKEEAVPYDANLIRDSIKNGKLVILPAAGRLLGNPYFRQPGPLYHMLVVKGFEGNEFITNDPGTKRGLSYRYTEEALVYAVHDWNGGEVEAGKQVMIVVSDELE